MALSSVKKKKVKLLQSYTEIWPWNPSSRTKTAYCEVSEARVVRVTTLHVASQQKYFFNGKSAWVLPGNSSPSHTFLLKKKYTNSVMAYYPHPICGRGHSKAMYSQAQKWNWFWYPLQGFGTPEKHTLCPWNTAWITYSYLLAKQYWTNNILTEYLLEMRLYTKYNVHVLWAQPFVTQACVSVWLCILQPRPKSFTQTEKNNNKELLYEPAKNAFYLSKRTFSPTFFDRAWSEYIYTASGFLLIIYFLTLSSTAAEPIRCKESPSQTSMCKICWARWWRNNFPSPGFR